MSLLTGQKLSKADIRQIYLNEMSLHPLSEMADVYKLFLQSCYGATHFIENPRQAKDALQREITSLEDEYLPYFQDISNGKGFYRLSLSLVRTGRIYIDEFCQCFLRSAVMQINWPQWSRQWNKILELIRPEMNDLYEEKQAELIRQSMDKKVIPSHSDCFRLTYKPHYRVMKLDFFPSETRKRILEMK